MRLEPVQVKLANTCPLAHAKYTISHSQATSHPMSAHRKLVIVILERKKKKNLLEPHRDLLSHLLGISLCYSSRRLEAHQNDHTSCLAQTEVD